MELGFRCHALEAGLDPSPSLSFSLCNPGAGTLLHACPYRGRGLETGRPDLGRAKPVTFAGVSVFHLVVSEHLSLDKA